MDKDQISAIANNPNNIPGIYNYCDRWCERCAHTQNCAVFAMEMAEQAKGNRSGDPFWEQLHQIMQTTLEMIKGHAIELGIDIDSPLPDNILERMRQSEEEVNRHPCRIEAVNYGKRVHSFFTDHENVLNDSINNEQRINNIIADQRAKHALSLNDSLEIIRWYQYLIGAKADRAISGIIDDGLGLTESEVYDRNGSAKVALLAIDRSIGAWSVVLDKLPELEEDIFEILIHLSRLQKMTDKIFPEARGFIRPGLDE